MKVDIDRQMLRSLLVLASIVEARDAYTGGHLWRVAQFAKKLGHAAGLEGDDLFRLTVSAFLHDVGKVGIPDSVLLKKGKLTDEEFAIIRTHPKIGHDLLIHHPLGGLVLDVIAHHHEWIDGHGYPDGIERSDVSVHSRIVALVDAYDALTSVRPYRSGLDPDKAQAILEEGRGVHFDGGLLDTFNALHIKGELAHIVGHSFSDRPLIECPQCGPVIVPKKDQPTVVCRVCTGEFQLHAAGDAMVAEFTGNHATADRLRPEPELDAIGEVVSQAPVAATF